MQLQNKAQPQAKRICQSYISRREKQLGSLGAKPLAAGGKRGFGGGAPTLWRFYCFSKNTHF